MKNQKNEIKFVNDSKGKPLEVILPVRYFNELIDLKDSMEIYKREDTQKSIRRAKKDFSLGHYQKFTNAEETLKWLNNR